MTYVHFGNNEYIPFAGVRNVREWQKPKGGLWGSREGDPNGWEAWCRKEHYQLQRLKNHFSFTLTKKSRILTLEKEKQLIDLPKQKPWEPKDLSWMETLEPDQIPTSEQLDEWLSPNWCLLDFEKLAKQYDAIELMNAGAFRSSLSLWDCNCILVMNPDVIQVF